MYNQNSSCLKTVLPKTSLDSIQTSISNLQDNLTKSVMKESDKSDVQNKLNKLTTQFNQIKTLKLCNTYCSNNTSYVPSANICRNKLLPITS